MPESTLPDLRIPAPAGAEAGEPHDPFGPPRTAVEVGCLHCGQVYCSDRIWFDERDGGPPGPEGRRGFWACPVAGCDGIGFAFDIWPTDPDYRDEETGEKYWIEDAGDEEWEEEGWEEDDSAEAVPAKPRADATAAAFSADVPPGNGMFEQTPPDEEIPF